MFSAEGGWPFGEVRDTDPIFEKEKQIEAGNPVRDVSIPASRIVALWKRGF